STMPRKGRDKGGKGGQGAKAPRRTENDVERTDDPMPCFTLSPVRVEDLDRLEGSIGPCVRGPLEEPSPVEGAVDVGRIDHSGLIYRYRRGAGYPKHFPLDEHLLPFIQNFMPANWDGSAGLLATERAQLERAILTGRDSMMGTCSPHHPSFPLDHEAQAHFPDTALLGLFAPEPAHRVTELRLSQGQWEVQGLPKTGIAFIGHTLPPSGRDFVQDGYDRSCFLDRILGGGAASWYDRWSVVSSHRFRFGATEWLMGILYHYQKMLERVGLLEAVVAALHSYPCNPGLLQALAERFNRRFNTFGIAEGETSLDLWALHRISGLPISGQFYEEVCLSDLDRDRTSGAGSYFLSHSFRYLARVWRDLAKCGRSDCPSASRGTVRVSCDAWIRFFYNGPFCFYKEFAGDNYDPAAYAQLKVRLDDDARYLYAPRGVNWNPRRLLDRTHLAAYLVYWLCTFALPFGEEGNIRPEAIYPACILANGVQLALAPAALANIFCGLGELTSSPSPRDKNITLATHYLGAWAGLLLSELCHNISLERPSMPLIFMFRNRPEREQQKQLKEARRRLSFVPAAGQPGLDLACCSLGFRPWVEEGQRGCVYRLPHHATPIATLRKDWLCCVLPSVLLFRKGSLLFMEPYFPHRFARNLGYDQDVPPNADFVLSTWAYKGPDRHLVASSWWCYFLRRDAAPEFFIPELRHEGRVGILYARWWSRHSQAFRECADDIKKAERHYLSRTGAPVSTIAPTFLEREFADIAQTVTTMGRRRATAQAASMADSEAFAGALKPLSRPESSSAASRVRGEPPLVYFWWRHFLLDCGYTVDAALTSSILPSVTRVWERHLQQSIIRVGPREFISWIESGTTLRHFWDAIAEAGKAVKVPFDRVVLRPTFSVAPRECFIPEKDLPRRDTPSARKRRASEEAGASTSGVGELAEGTPREDVAPQGDEDYNPTFDGTPSPEGADIPPVASTETGYIPVEAAAAEGVERQAGVVPVGDAASSLQAIHDLLLSGSEAELPGFSDFVPGILEGAGWQQPLHSAMAVTSAAVLPTASPPEEGEVARGIARDADDGAKMAAEMMGSSPPGAVLPPAARGVEGMLDLFTASAHTVMEEGNPPSVDAVRDFLERSTVAYHLMGCPEIPGWPLWTRFGAR
ncbi:hypothetical protein Taro_004367, partial [Colocasia esculenta]|nr:hypothetical protein [Colocasia esculenta]